jgi:hypothetical protein
MRVSLGFLPAVLLLAACDAGGATQIVDSTVTFRRPACSNCSIESDSIAQLGSPSDMLMLTLLPRVDSRGYFYSTGSGRPTQIIVFAADGNVVGGFGTPGSGPGLVGGVNDIILGSGDSLYVLSDARMHVFSANHEQIREVPVDGRSLASGMGAPLVMNYGDQQNTVPLHDGTMLRAGRNHTFRILSPDGGVGPPVTLPSDSSLKCAFCKFRTYIPAAAAGHIYSATEDDYVVEELELTGNLVRRFVRDVSWFPRYRPRAVPATNEAGLAELSRPRLMGIRRTADGMIWTHSLVMDKANPVPMSVVELFVGIAENLGDVPLDIATQVQTHFTTVVEVFDPVKNELLATATYPYLLFPMSGDLAARPQRHGPIASTWTVFRLRLKRPP